MVGHWIKQGAGAAAGLLIAADACAARLLLNADASRVYVLGRPVEWVCSFRSRLGIPCPGCGFTRSVVLSLHGEVGTAWQLSPAGPIAVLGSFALAAALVAPFTTKRWIIRGALVYAALTTLLWIGSWIMKVF